MTITESEVQKNEGRVMDQLHESKSRPFRLRGGHVGDVLARIEEPQPRGKTNLKGKALQHDFVSMSANIRPRVSLAHM